MRDHRLRSHSLADRFILVLLAGLLLPACQGDAETEASLLANAEEYLQIGNHKAAVLELQNVVRLNPESAKGRWLLGRTQLEVKDPAAAAKELRRAVELGWPPADVAVPLGRALLASNPGGLAEGLKTLGDESVLPSGVRGELSVIRALGMLRTGDSGGALDQFNMADRLASDTTAGGYARAFLAFLNGDRDTARRELEHVLVMDPARAEAIGLRGDLAMADGNAEAAVAAYLEALSLDSGNVLFRLALARAQLATGAPEDASSTLEPLLEAKPSLPDANYLRAVAALALNDITGAESFALAALRGNPSDLASHYVAGVSAYELKKYESAHRHLKQIPLPQADPAAMRLLVRTLASTQFKLGMVEDGMKTLSHGGEPAPGDADFFRTVGTALSAAGYAEAGRTLFNRASKAEPGNVGTQVALGVTELHLGNESEGMKTLERAISMAPESVETEALAIVVEMKRRNLDAAMTGAQRLVEEHPELPLGHNLLGTVNGLLGRAAEAKKSFERALELDPDNLDTLNNLGLIYFSEGAWDRARNALGRVADARKLSLGALLKLATAESRLGDEKQAMARLQQAVASYPDAAAPRTALARIYLATGRAQEAVDVAFDYSVNRELPPELLDVLGSAQLDLKQYEAAAKTLASLAEQRPDDLRVHWNLARAYERSGKFAPALQAAEKALTIDSSQESIRFFRARMLATVGRSEDAERVVQDLLAKHPKSYDLIDLSGTIAMQRGQFEKAADAYQQAFALRETNLELLKWSRALMAAGKVAEAEKLLKDWTARNPKDVLTITVLANYFLQQSRNAEAEASFIEVLRLNPDDAGARNNLAWLLLQSGKTDEAFVEAERAHFLESENPYILDTLGQVLLAKGESDRRALQLLRGAAAALPDDRDVQVNLAKALVRTGASADARVILEKLLGDSEDFSNRKQAQELLDRLR